MAHGWLRTQIPREATLVSAGNDQHHSRDAGAFLCRRRVRRRVEWGTHGRCSQLGPTGHDRSIESWSYLAGERHVCRELTISKDLNLLGVRLDPTLDGNASGSVLSVNSDALVAVRNLAITNGNAALGGGIDVEGGSVSLLDASVTDNKATNGGGSSTSAGRSSCAMATNHL